MPLENTKGTGDVGWLWGQGQEWEGCSRNVEICGGFFLAVPRGMWDLSSLTRD